MAEFCQCFLRRLIKAYKTLRLPPVGSPTQFLQAPFTVWVRVLRYLRYLHNNECSTFSCLQNGLSHRRTKIDLYLESHAS